MDLFMDTHIMAKVKFTPSSISKVSWSIVVIFSKYSLSYFNCDFNNFFIFLKLIRNTVNSFYIIYILNFHFRVIQVLCTKHLFINILLLLFIISKFYFTLMSKC